MCDDNRVLLAGGLEASSAGWLDPVPKDTKVEVLSWLLLQSSDLRARQYSTCTSGDEGISGLSRRPLVTATEREKRKLGQRQLTGCADFPRGSCHGGCSLLMLWVPVSPGRRSHLPESEVCGWKDVARCSTSIVTGKTAPNARVCPA